MKRRLVILSLLYLPSPLLAGCSDDDERVAVDDHDPTSMDASLDGSLAGDMDAEIGDEVVSFDAAALGLDGSLDLPPGTIIRDGSVILPDGMVLDVDAAVLRYKDDFEVESCEIADEDKWQDQVQLEDEGGYDLTPGRVGFGLSYKAITGGDCSQAVNLLQIPSVGPFPLPVSLADECHSIRDVGLLYGDERWHMAWVDNESGMAELYHVELDEDMEPQEERKRLTENDLVFEFRPSLAVVNERALLVWISRDVVTDEHWITGRFLDEPQEQFTILDRSAGQKPQAVAVSQISNGAGAVAWVGSVDKPGVWLRRLAMDAKPTGDPIQLASLVSESSSVSLARRHDGGGVAYSVVVDGLPQVKFRRLDYVANPVADERTIIGRPARAQDAGLWALGSGYALAYRALPETTQDEAEIRMVFISREGNVPKDAAGRVSSFAIAPATYANGRIDVVVSVEGQIMLAWADADPDSRDNLLKVVRRRLDCQR